MRCISAKLFHVYQTVGVLIAKWLPIRQLLTTQHQILALPKSAAPTRSDNSISDVTVYMTLAFQIVRRARDKKCSKSKIDSF